MPEPTSRRDAITIEPILKSFLPAGSFGQVETLVHVLLDNLRVRPAYLDAYLARRAAPAKCRR